MVSGKQVVMVTLANITCVWQAFSSVSICRLSSQISCIYWWLLTVQRLVSIYSGQPAVGNTMECNTVLLLHILRENRVPPHRMFSYIKGNKSDIKNKLSLRTLKSSPGSHSQSVSNSVGITSSSLLLAFLLLVSLASSCLCCLCFLVSQTRKVSSYTSTQSNRSKSTIKSHMATM